MLFLKQPLILPFLYHKSATTYQNDSYKVSNSKLKPELCDCVKTELIKLTASPRWSVSYTPCLCNDIETNLKEICSFGIS